MVKAPSLKARRATVILSLVFAVSLFSSSVPYADRQTLAYSPATPVEEANYAPGEVLVKTAQGQVIESRDGRVLASSAPLAAVIERYGFTGIEQIAPDTFKLSVPSGSPIDVPEAVRALEAQAAVTYAGPNRLYRAMLAPNDEQYVRGQQWGVTQIKAEQAWDITTGSENVIIAILDTGTAADHPDLEAKIVAGYDAANNDEDPSDDQGHGTYTAGIAAAESNNGTGVVGISWGARIMPVKVLRASGQGEEVDIAEGIRWAVDHGARIISASLGGEEDSPVMRDAVQYAVDHNVLLVAAAGNTPDGKDHFPAAYDSVLAVGATGRSDTFTGFSSWGRYVDVTAPGVGVLSTGWDNGTLTYEYGNGTSASCPFVSGVAALVWTVNPNLTAVQVKQIIEDSADDLGDPGWDEHYGMGRLNAFRAVQMAQRGAPPPRTPTTVGQPTPPPAATATRAAVAGLQVNTTNVNPGTLISITGAGFGSNELIDLRITGADGKQTGIGNAQTGAQGGFRAEAALPTNLPPGKATLMAVGATSKLQASVELTVGGQGGGGQSVVRGVLRGVSPGSGPAPALAGAALRIKPASGTAGPEMSAQADAAGAFSFTGLPAGIYALSVSAAGYLPAGPYSVQVDGTAGDVRVMEIPVHAGKPQALNRVPAIPNNSNQAFFPAVGHTLKGPFLRYWQQKGGLAIFGYPITEEFEEVSATDGKKYLVQYFERNRFEYHPEFAGSANEVLMGLLGVDMTRGRTFQPGVPFLSDNNRFYFRETGHSLSGPFLRYWQQKGGLAIFGYPISEELMENGYRVQYFERNRFEYHPEFAGSANEVLLGLLGVETAKRYGWIEP